MSVHLHKHKYTSPKNLKTLFLNSFVVIVYPCLITDHDKCFPMCQCDNECKIVQSFQLYLPYYVLQTALVAGLLSQD